MGHKLVAHLLDGRLIKAWRRNVVPDRPLCHILTRERGMVAIHLTDLAITGLQGGQQSFGASSGYSAGLARDRRCR